MKDKKRKKTKDSTVLFLFFCCFFIFIGGCEDSQDKPIKENENETEKKVITTIEPLPLIEEKEYQFQSSFGWIDDKTILYSAMKDEQYYLFAYDVSSEMKKELFSTNEMISEASVSFNKEYILVYSSDNTSNANIRIISTKGEELFVVSVPSMEISISWNPFDENTILVDSFEEDWSFKTYIIHIKDNKIEEINVPQPFAQWYSKESLLYINWDIELSQVAAPLMKYTIQTGEQELLFEDVMSFQKEEDVLLLIRENKEDISKVKYEFYNNVNTKINDIQLSVTESYSDWYALPYNFVSGKQSILTFIQHEPAFNQENLLLSYDWKNGEHTIVMEGLEPAPISCSPNGEYCLYGYTLENIIKM